MPVDKSLLIFFFILYVSSMGEMRNGYTIVIASKRNMIGGNVVAGGWML
jgi:hypothetical protein